MNEAIWFRGQYAPTETGEYRVGFNEHKVWTLDRAEYNSSGVLVWSAADINMESDPIYAGCIKAHHLMDDQIRSGKVQPGFFLAEQLRQFAASLAGRSLERRKDVKPEIAAAVAVRQIAQLTEMPLKQAIINLQREHMLPDTNTAMQAQLMLSACRATKSSALVPLALDSMRRDHFDIANSVNSLTEDSSAVATRALRLSSPELVALLRKDLLAREADQRLAGRPYLHFSTPQEAFQHFDAVANHPIERADQGGTYRVVRNWATNALEAEQLVSLADDNDDIASYSWMRVNNPQGQAAILAYNIGLGAAPGMFDDDSLLIESYAQRAAQIAAQTQLLNMASLDSADVSSAAAMALAIARKEASTLFTCEHQLALPTSVDLEDEVVQFQMDSLATMQLTKAGIESHIETMGRSPDHRPDSLEALTVKGTNTLAVGMTLRAPEIRLELHSEPKHYLSIDTRGADLSSLQPLLQVKAHEVESLEAGPALEHQYDVVVATRSCAPDSLEEGTDYDWEQGVMDASDAKRFFRDKGLEGEGRMVQYGDGSWGVAWESQQPEESRAYFEQGVETYYALKLVEVNGEQVTPGNAAVFARDAGAKVYNPYEQLQRAPAAAFKMG